MSHGMIWVVRPKYRIYAKKSEVTCWIYLSLIIVKQWESDREKQKIQMIYLAESRDERNLFLFKNWYQVPISGIYLILSPTFSCKSCRVGWECYFIFHVNFLRPFSLHLCSMLLFNPFRSLYSSFYIHCSSRRKYQLPCMVWSWNMDNW